MAFIDSHNPTQLSSWASVLIIALFPLYIQGTTLTVSSTTGGVLGVSPYNTIVIDCTVEAELGSEITAVNFQWTESRTNSVLPASVTQFSATTAETVSGATSTKTAISSATISFNDIFSPGVTSYYYFACSVTATITDSTDSSQVVSSSGQAQVPVKGPTSPRSPEIGEVTPLSHSVVIRWTVSSVAYTPETYTVHYGTDSAILNTTSDSLMTDTTNDFLNIKDQDYRLTINGLQPAQKYYYYVTSTNSYSSRNTEKYSFITTESSPGPPNSPQLIATSFSSSLLFLSWGEPIETNGKIIGYQYLCYANKDSNAVVQAQLVDPTVRGVIIDGDGTGLQPMTSYTCEVMAFTMEGDGVTVSVTKETASITTGSGSELSHCVLEIVTSGVIVFTITFTFILTANILISCLFLKHQKRKYLGQLQGISETAPQGKRYIKSQPADEQDKQGMAQQHASHVKPPMYAPLPYYNTVRPNNQTHIHLKRNPAYL